MKMTRAIAILLFSAVSFVATAGEIVLYDSGFGGVTASIGNPAPVGSTPGLAGPGGLVGGIGGPIGFVVPTAGVLHITVTDQFLTGDVFEVILDGLSLGTTPGVPIGGPSHSIGDFFVSESAGAHGVDIWDFILSYIGFTSPYGGTVTPNYSPAGLEVRVALVVPEPSSMLLLGIGLVALGVFGRRKLN
jgi:hypothetical protein